MWYFWLINKSILNLSTGINWEFPQNQAKKIENIFLLNWKIEQKSLQYIRIEIRYSMRERGRRTLENIIEKYVIQRWEHTMFLYTTLFIGKTWNCYNPPDKGDYCSYKGDYWSNILTQDTYTKCEEYFYSKPQVDSVY